MDAKNKAKVQGILIGTGMIALLMFFDKTYGPNAIEELAGEYTVFAWIFFWIVACGSSTVAREKQLLVDENPEKK